MTITLNLSTLKSWWPQILVAGALAYHVISPELTNLATNHPHIYVWVSAGLLFAGTLLKSPMSSTPPTIPPSLSEAIAKARKG